ncbi:MAG TPA: alpha/beta hydrolase [Candidatus Pullichristensenella excrementigallinarum]|uniref:Alpha/beta hydrolase n=1 Tax=Candidatus Pullichristensenella excrementigallinarum TaxID=2840907 RepID=A0A9D1IAK0_9FIRM|nr:alpha/beta hydrolase [Candidatus Pullichristensenella excrementigallinarum]
MPCERTRYQERIVEVGMYFEHEGARLYYDRQGSGAPLLMLHGWGGRADSFLPAIRDFQAVRTVYAVDFPGHGNSPEPPEPWSVTEYMELIRAFIRRMGIEGTDIMAHSFGGRVALLLAATYPEAVGKMVLTGCAGLRPKPSGKKKARTRVYRALRALADNGLTRRLCPKTVERTREALVQKFGSPDYRQLSPAMRRTFNRVIAQDLQPCLRRIQASTLLIWGTEDRDTPLWMGETMEREIPDAALIRFEGAGHFAYLDRYGEFRAIAWKFLIG